MKNITIDQAIDRQMDRQIDSNSLVVSHVITGTFSYMAEQDQLDQKRHKALSLRMDHTLQFQLEQTSLMNHTSSCSNSK